MPSTCLSGRCLAMRKPRSEARPGGVRGSAPRTSDPRAHTAGPGKPASVRTLRHQARSIDWTLVQYRVSESDGTKHDCAEMMDAFDDNRTDPTHTKESRPYSATAMRRCNFWLRSHDRKQGRRQYPGTSDFYPQTTPGISQLRRVIIRLGRSGSHESSSVEDCWIKCRFVRATRARSVVGCFCLFASGALACAGERELIARLAFCAVNLDLLAHQSHSFAAIWLTAGRTIRGGGANGRSAPGLGRLR
jgi:hypothetical protein